MIEEIKKIKLEGLNKNKNALEEKKESIYHKLTELNNELSNLQNRSSEELTVKFTFSFWEKWITKRKEYKEFVSQNKTSSAISIRITEIKEEIKLEEQRVKKELETLRIDEKISDIVQNMNLIKNAKTIYEMRISPIEAMIFLEKNGIQPVLSESDKVIIEHPRDFSSKDSVIGVHKTRFSPSGNMIKSLKDANALEEDSITVNGIQYKFYYRLERNTVHMALNGEVSSHGDNSWKDCKYAILIPLKDISNDKIVSAAPMDTFTLGSIELTEDTWILCPKDEVESVKKINPKVHVLGYEGKNAMGYADSFLTQLGYRYEENFMWGWKNKESAVQFFQLASREGLDWEPHSDTCYYEDEEILTTINKTISMIKLIRDKQLIKKTEDIEELRDGEGYNIGEMLIKLLPFSNIDGKTHPEAIKANNKQFKIFIEELKKNGINISKAYQDVMIILGETNIDSWNKETRDRILNYEEDISEEERRTIEELKEVFSPVEPFKKYDAFEKFISIVIGDAILKSPKRDLSEEINNEER